MLLVFVVLGGFPHGAVERELAPTLWKLAADGGWAYHGGIAELPAVASTNHATFVTGRSAVGHGIVADRVPIDGSWLPASEVGPEVPTLFDACRAAGLRTAAVVADPDLLGVCGAEAASQQWPPTGQSESTGLSESSELNEPTASLRYSDSEVLQAVASLDLDALDFAYVHFGDAFAARQMYGAGSEAARKQCVETDATLGQFVDLLGPRWSETVLIVVSDHDHEKVEGAIESIDYGPLLPEGVMALTQGTAALIIGSLRPGDLLALKGVAGIESLDLDHHLVWGRPGHSFGGDHGSPRSSSQLAVVGGGHPKAAMLAARLGDFRPPARVWAGWMAETLDLSWRPEAYGDRSQPY